MSGKVWLVIALETITCYILYWVMYKRPTASGKEAPSSTEPRSAVPIINRKYRKMDFSERYDCPKCGSTQTQRLSEIFIKGQSKVTTTEEGFLTGLLSGTLNSDHLIGDGRFLVSNNQSESTTQTMTEEALQVRPPEPAIRKRLWTNFETMYLSSMDHETYNSDMLPRLFERWKAGMKCHKCGHTWSQVM